MQSHKRTLFLASFAVLALIVVGCKPVVKNDANINNSDDASAAVPAPGGDTEEMVVDDDAMDDGEAMEDDDAMEDNVDAMDDGAEVSFNVGGSNFAFTTDEISVKKGDKVTINFVSNDGFHDWKVDEFDAATEQVNTGGATSVTFTADQAGSFEYYCSVGNHRALGMVGTLIVE
jgi:plastocyanin